MKKTFLRFRRDRSGSYMIIAGLMMPVLVGFAGLATEGGLWLYTHQTMLSAADAAAVSAARAGRNVYQEARGVAASYGFVDGANGATVTVNQPPKSGNYKSTPGAVEVIVHQQQRPLFSAVLRMRPFGAQARAVATSYAGCVFALDHNADRAIRVDGNAQVTMTGCSLEDNSSSARALAVDGSATLSAQSVMVVGGVSGDGDITAAGGVRTHISPVADPYASVSQPTLPHGVCNHTGFSTNSTTTLDPGVYCNGISVHAGADVTLNPGVYFLDQGTLSIDGGATVSGNGVTIVFTSSTGNMWADAKIDGNASINLTAPNSGRTAGIVFFGDRNGAGTSFTLEGGATQTLGGAVYLPAAEVKFTGGSAAGGCTQLIADRIEFEGNSVTNVQLNCSGYAIKPIGLSTAALVE